MNNNSKSVVKLTLYRNNGTNFDDYFDGDHSYVTFDLGSINITLNEYAEFLKKYPSGNTYDNVINEFGAEIVGEFYDVEHIDGSSDTLPAHMVAHVETIKNEEK